MTTASCCTCASVLSIESEAYDPDTEKPIKHKTLPCCGRQICALCIEKNPRFEAYCPFCQSTRLPPLSQEKTQAESSRVPAEDPPPYSTLSPIPRHTPPPAPRPRHATLSFSSEQRPSSPLPPPAYEPAGSVFEEFIRPLTPPYQPGDDVIHYLSQDDSFQSISLAYRVPIHVLKAHNNIHSDHLLSARRKINIPASHYQGPSLSPFELEDPVERERKSKIRKLMVKCKVAEYKVAVMYLEEVGWNLEKAQARVEEDDKWEREHPIAGSSSIVHAPVNLSSQRLRLAEPFSPKRIARLLS